MGQGRGHGRSDSGPSPKNSISSPLPHRRSLFGACGHALSPDRRVVACKQRLLAATRARPECEGGWRAEKRKILMARALRHAGAFRRANRGVFRQRALLSSGPSRIECADRAVSQLLAGTPSGPGGSSDAARVPRCDEARRRRTSSRLRDASRERPLEGRGGGIDKRGLEGGDYVGRLASPWLSSSPAEEPGSRAIVVTLRQRQAALRMPAFAGRRK